MGRGLSSAAQRETVVTVSTGPSPENKQTKRKHHNNDVKEMSKLTAERKSEALDALF